MSVILFEPAYDFLFAHCAAAGGIPVYVQLKYPTTMLTWNEVKDRDHQKTNSSF